MAIKNMRHKTARARALCEASNTLPRNMSRQQKNQRRYENRALAERTERLN
jgi:hypothetical protein